MKRNVEFAFTYPRHLHRLGENLHKERVGFHREIVVYVGNHRILPEGVQGVFKSLQFCQDLIFQRLSIGIFDVVGGMEDLATVMVV